MLADRSAFRKVSVLHAAGACASRGSKPRRASTSPCALCASSASTRSVATGRCSSCLASTNRACRPPTLSTNEVCTLLGVIRHPVRRRALGTIYALGLRLGELCASKPTTSMASARGSGSATARMPKTPAFLCHAYCSLACGSTASASGLPLPRAMSSFLRTPGSCTRRFSALENRAAVATRGGPPADNDARAELRASRSAREKMRTSPLCT